MQNCSLLISLREREAIPGRVCCESSCAQIAFTCLLVSQDMARAPQRLPAGPLPTSQALALAGPKVGLAFSPGHLLSLGNDLGVNRADIIFVGAVNKPVLS